MLGEIAREVGLGRETFLADLASEAAQQETWTDFAIAQRAGIRGFPTLLGGAAEGGRIRLVTQGFQPPRSAS